MYPTLYIDRETGEIIVGRDWMEKEMLERHGVANATNSDAGEYYEIILPPRLVGKI